MMMRRYVDASRTFQDILVFLSKISAVNSLSYQYDQMLKKQDQPTKKKELRVLRIKTEDF